MALGCVSLRPIDSGGHDLCSQQKRHWFSSLLCPNQSFWAVWQPVIKDKQGKKIVEYPSLLLVCCYQPACVTQWCGSYALLDFPFLVKVPWNPLPSLVQVGPWLSWLHPYTAISLYSFHSTCLCSYCLCIFFLLFSLTSRSQFSYAGPLTSVSWLATPGDRELLHSDESLLNHRSESSLPLQFISTYDKMGVTYSVDNYLQCPLKGCKRWV